MLGKKKGQSTLEYALIIIVVVAAFLLLRNYMQRSVQGRLRASSDQVGNQFDIKTGNTTWQNIGGQKVANPALTTVTVETHSNEEGGMLYNTTSAEIIERQEDETWAGAN